VELGGLEPPTSWVRFQPWRITGPSIFGFAEPILDVCGPSGEGQIGPDLCPFGAFWAQKRACAQCGFGWSSQRLSALARKFGDVSGRRRPAGARLVPRQRAACRPERNCGCVVLTACFRPRGEACGRVFVSALGRSHSATPSAGSILGLTFVAIVAHHFGV
jgi:hypothetical protein